jgi:signal transduction histidine kinase
MEKETDLKIIHDQIKNQKQDTKNLADIINALLEISKLESEYKSEPLRLDDLLYDTIEEVKAIDEDFLFEISIDGKIEEEKSFKVNGNHRLLKLALINILINCINYSENRKANIKITSIGQNIRLEFINNGQVIGDEEKQYLFQHFFRGKNSKGKRGFGLGLVLINKIMLLHKGSIEYTNPDLATNIFTLSLPLHSP